MQVFPSYMTSREIAGAPVSGDIFKCQTQSVSHAIASGVYGRVDMTPYQETLEHIFPDGVCDFTQPGLGYPENLTNKPMLAYTPEPEEKTPANKAAEMDKQPSTEDTENPSNTAPSEITLSKLEGGTTTR